MKIQVHDWSFGRLLAGTPYEQGHCEDGTEEDALRIAGEIFKAGPNVMLVHRDNEILIQVDDQRFQQR